MNPTLMHQLYRAAFHPQIQVQRPDPSNGTIKISFCRVVILPDNYSFPFLQIHCHAHKWLPEMVMLIQYRWQQK
jgi:hypothetical protein